MNDDTKPQDPAEKTEEPAAAQDEATSSDNSQQAAAEEKCQELEDKWKRTVAELQNYQQQVERDKVEFVKFASERTLTALLPVLDNFKRASSHLPKDLKDNEWAKGIEAIEAQFEQALGELGLKKIEVKKKEACDPNRHEVVATEEGKQGCIIEVLEAGYELNGKVLRAAKVKVGK